MSQRLGVSSALAILLYGTPALRCIVSAHSQWALSQIFAT